MLFSKDTASKCCVCLLPYQVKTADGIEMFRTGANNGLRIVNINNIINTWPSQENSICLVSHTGSPLLGLLTDEPLGNVIHSFCTQVSIA